MKGEGECREEFPYIRESEQTGDDERAEKVGEKDEDDKRNAANDVDVSRCRVRQEFVFRDARPTGDESDNDSRRNDYSHEE